MRRALTALALICATLLAGIAWLLGSESGLQAALRLAGSLSAGQAQASDSSGRLLGPLRIGQLRWQSEDIDVSIDDLRLDWLPSALLDGRLHVTSLTMTELAVKTAASSEPAVPPEQVLLPLSVTVDAFAVARLQVDDLITVANLGGRLASDGQRHELSGLRAALGDVAAAGNLRVDGAAPVRLDGGLSIDGQLAERPLGIDLTATGELAAISVHVTGRQGIAGTAEALLTPFAATPFTRARIDLSDIDPAAWLAAAPTARLAVSGELLPQGDAFAGSLNLRNSLPGPLDRQRLPLVALALRLAGDSDAARLSELRLDLAGGGQARGQGSWREGRLALDLKLNGIDAAQLYSPLQRTRLGGSLRTTLGENEQTVSLDLSDSRFNLAAEASHAAGLIDVPRLELRAGEARLQLAGRLASSGRQEVAVEGTFSRFDPSRFGQWPKADINGRFAANGHLAPQPVITADFQLTPSRLADQPLSGQGRLSIDWPSIPQADVALQAGPNQLRAAGSFGRPDSLLRLQIHAPALSPYGVDGDLKGWLELRGTLAKPALSVDLQTSRLALPGIAAVRDAALRATLGSAADAPLALDLEIGRLGLGERPEALRQLRLAANGSNRRHDGRFAGELPDGSRLTLSAAGGLETEGKTWRWRGQLREARLAGSEPARNAALAAPADLLLGADAWAIGPLQLAGSPLDWRATLEARADSRRLLASLNASGSRVGRVDGRLEAAMRDPWQIARNSPWLGSLTTDIADLSWLGELLGDGWRSSGRFQASLKIDGTPAQPVGSGRFAGERLALRLPAQGLALTEGELSGELLDNVLHLRRLNFVSPLQPLPRALRLRTGEALADQLQRPGRLEASGQMRLAGESGNEQAALDIRLERLGVFQLPEQWVALSGNGRLTWHGGGFGISGRLLADAGYWQLTPGGVPRLSDDVIVRRSGDVAPPPLRPAVELDLTADLGPHFLFSGAGLNSRLAGEIRLQASGRDLPRASGSIRLRDGRFDAYGQRLAIKRGILSFQGLLDNPTLDVLAVRQGLPVEPGVQISGTAQRPVIRLVSDPELPDAEKLAWLVLGHGPESMGAGDATVLLSAAGGLLGNESGGLVAQLKNTFGIDEFGVRQGELGSTGGRAAGSRVAGSGTDTTASTGTQILSLGKRLSSNALLSYEQALGRAEGIVKLTVNLNRQLSIVGRAGSDNALDIFYSIAFGRQPAPRQAQPVPTD